MDAHLGAAVTAGNGSDGLAAGGGGGGGGVNSGDSRDSCALRRVDGSPGDVAVAGMGAEFFGGDSSRSAAAPAVNAAPAGGTAAAAPAPAAATRKLPLPALPLEHTPGPEPPADVDDPWLDRWAEADEINWRWQDGWALAQMYPRRELPHGGISVAEAGLAPQAAVTVEQQ